MKHLSLPCIQSSLHFWSTQGISMRNGCCERCHTFTSFAALQNSPFTPIPWHPSSPNISQGVQAAKALCFQLLTNPNSSLPHPCGPWRCNFLTKEADLWQNKGICLLSSVTVSKQKFRYVTIPTGTGWGQIIVQPQKKKPNPRNNQNQKPPNNSCTRRLCLRGSLNWTLRNYFHSCLEFAICTWAVWHMALIIFKGSTCDTASAVCTWRSAHSVT